MNSLEELASINEQWSLDRPMPKRATGLLDPKPITNLASQLSTIVNQLGKLNMNSIQSNIVYKLLCRKSHHG